MNNTPLTSILKNISPLGYSEAVSVCIKRMEKHKKTAVFTPNSEMLYHAIKSEKQMKLLLSADILFPDGVGIYTSMKALGFSPKEKTVGIELGEKLLCEAARHGYRVFLLGAKNGVAEKAAMKLRSKHKGLNICGCHHGYFEKHGKENDAVIERINRSEADIVFVCFGFPAQESWIKENLPRLSSAKLCIGLGGSIDVWSENIKRAPAPIVKMGLEWLWRTAKDPKRIKRLPSLLFFSLFALKEYIAKRSKQYNCYEIDNFLK